MSDRYQTIKKLGQGTYGSVFLCRQKATGRQCVMKRMQLNTLDDRERTSALQESQLLQQLQHPNIVAYVDSIATRSKLFLFMQYCDGGDLEQRLAACKKEHSFVDEQQLLDWFVQMSLALQYLHDRRILHRDLKTANVFLTRAGIVKLGDFGVSRVLSATAELAKTFVGTPYYLSPELLSNVPYGPASDVWALGCIFYEIATLEHPFDAKNFPALAQKIVHTEPEPIALRRPIASGGDPPSLDRLFRMMIHKTPEERAGLPALLCAPIVQRRMLAFVREVDPAAPCSSGAGASAAAAPPPPPAAPARRSPEQRGWARQAAASRGGGAAARPWQPAAANPPEQQQWRRRGGGGGGAAVGGVMGARAPSPERAVSPEELVHEPRAAPSHAYEQQSLPQQQPPVSSSPRKRGKRRGGGVSAGGGGAGGAAEVPPPMTEADIVAAIEVEEARLQSRLAELHAAKQLAASVHSQPSQDSTPDEYEQGREHEQENEREHEQRYQGPYDDRDEARYAEDPHAPPSLAIDGAHRLPGGGGVGIPSEQLSPELQVKSALDAAAAAAAATIACAGGPWTEPPPFQAPAPFDEVPPPASQLAMRMA